MDQTIKKAIEQADAILNKAWILLNDTRRYEACTTVPRITKKEVRKIIQKSCK